MDLTFFGLTLNKEHPNYIEQRRLSLFTQIHEIVAKGGGGFDYLTVYNMPIWLRKFTFHRLKEDIEETNTPSDQPNTAIGQDGIVKDKSMFKTPNKSQSNLVTAGPKAKSPVQYK